jgi:hypothetical protein
MGKYFSSDSDLSQYNVSEENSIDTTNVIPSTDNLTKPLSDETKEQLIQSTPSTTDEHINVVKQQTEHVSQMIQTYSEESKQEFKNHFEKFAPAELFEKLNQLIFVVTDLSNRITSLENNTSGTPPNKTHIRKEISNPQELYEMQEHGNISESIKIPDNNQTPVDIESVKKDIANIKKGKTPKNIPSDGLTDNTVNLEEMFPDLDDDGLQAAYASMSEKKVDRTTVIKPVPGNMRSITGF